MTNPQHEVSPTLHNYLKKWDGRADPLVREICESLYQLQIDFDELSDNRMAILEDKFHRLEMKIDAMQEKEKQNDQR